jgi:predicted anti-sigma-YlaC factor YlaD
MNRPDQHPDSELLDQLRAGLLDEHPSQKAELQAHIQQCEVCRRGYDWPAALRSDQAQNQRLLGQLDGARRQALLTRKKTALRRFAPLAAAAAIALVAVLVVKPLQSPDTDDTRLAGTTPGAVPEIYEDLDFYLWLSDHKASPDSST